MKANKSRVTVILIFLVMVFCVLIAFKLLSVFFPKQAEVPAQNSRSGAQASGGGNAGRSGAGGESSPSSNGRPAGAGSNGGNAAGGRANAGNAAGSNGANGPNSGGRQGTAVRVQAVALGTVENSIMLSGDVLSASQVSIYPTVAGKLISLNVKTGDRVGRGTLVAMVDPSRPGDSFFANPVTSTVAGAVLSVPVNVGETLQTNSVICVLGDLSALRVETFVPERYTVYMKKGIKAQLVFEAMDGETFAAEVDEVSPVLDPASRTMRINLRLLPGESGRSDPRIIPGMFATVNLVTNSRLDVPVINRSAMINTYGKWVVFVVPQGKTNAERREVSIGLESEDRVEITGGLVVGDNIVIAGQNFLSDGDAVRIVE